MQWLANLALSPLFIFFAGMCTGAVLVLWADYFFRQRARNAAPSIRPPGANVVDELAHGLSLENCHVAVDRTKKAVQVGFNLRNSTDVPIRYEVEQISVVIQGKTATNPAFNNMGGVVARGAKTTFMYPSIPHVIGKTAAEARGIIVYKYGRAGPEANFTREANYTVSLTLGAKDHVYTILEENDGAL